MWAMFFQMLRDIFAAVATGAAATNDLAKTGKVYTCALKHDALLENAQRISDAKAKLTELGLTEDDILN